MKQNQTLGEAICEQTALRAVVRVEDLIFVPSRPKASASGSISPKKLGKAFIRGASTAVVDNPLIATSC